ncbi:eCIS core domain-containing protein [Streptomyces tremellae]|uniref:DUF4157 domain-containing protein n=1 Tax=Streptomyces tremellae TaxID=1124239 RepID=A0ABP7FA15_9ACTN
MRSYEGRHRQRSPAPGRREGAEHSASPGELARLQASVGNQAVLRMMRRIDDGDGPAPAWAAERAGAGAGQDGSSGFSGAEPSPDLLGAEPAPGLSDVEAGLRAPGRPLDRATLARKEEQFRADLSGVRMHTGPAARQAAAAVRARAFTVDQDIVIGEGGTGAETLDHELTHAVRNLQQAPTGHPTGGGFAMTHPGDREEREAEANAARMRAGGPSSVLGADAASGPGRGSRGTTLATAVQRTGRTAVQRAGETDTAEQHAGGTAGAPGAAESAEIIDRLSRSIEQNTLQAKAQRNIFAPGTWVPEQWMGAGPARLRKTLDRRVMRGETFSAQDLEDIKRLSATDPEWLRAVQIGTYEEAETYIEGPFKDWLRLSSGKRVLIATLAIDKRPDLVAKKAATPTDPAYTLGRFMRTQAPGTDAELKESLEQERDRQIRDTAVDTLDPQGLAADRRHPDEIPAPGTSTGKGKGKATAPDWAEQDAQGRELLTRILLLLRNGLELYDPERKSHAPDYRRDVIRALAHGGRVNVRVPALDPKDKDAYWLPHFLGVTRDATRDKPAAGISERPFATHRTSIGPNKGGRPGTFKEKGGLAASLTNKVSIGAASPKLWGKDISGGGFGSKDWNGDMVLPNGSYGHVLLVYHRPTEDKDGSLQIGIETIAPHAESPVGYTHDFRSTEATSNPESILHGHKRDKVGAGGLSKNERLVDLRRMGQDRPGGWRGFLQEIQDEWDRRLAAAEDPGERRALYEELVGPREQPPSGAPPLAE